MGYIKKLKNNELVGGTDKHTIYPVTSTKAVFEEVTEGDKSSFKSQETINGEHQNKLDEHEGRLNVAETEDIKGITINHSETVHTVEEGTNIVNLTIYTAETADDQAIAGLVEQNYNNIISNADAIAAEKNRAEGTEESLQDQITDLDNGKQVKLSVGPGITLTEDGLISATADPAIGKVVETRPTTDIIEGMIYLVQTSTPGTYKQWVYDGSSWADKGNVSLSITADDEIDSTSTNPIQNNAITAQIGYFVCSASGSSPTKNVDAPSYSPSDVGGAFKIKMNNTNTCSDTVYLQFNSDAATKKELRYNRQPVTPTNTWDSSDGNPEVISVYYDGTYYQASNAQGGGGKAEKIKYDNSASGLAAKNVQVAMDLMANSYKNIIYRRITVTDNNTNNGYFMNSGSNAVWSYSGTYTRTHCLLERTANMKTVTMTRNNGLKASVAFLKTYTAVTTNLQPLDLCEGFLLADGVIAATSTSSTKTFVIPDDCNYIVFDLVYQDSSSKRDEKPANILIGEADAGTQLWEYDDIDFRSLTQYDGLPTTNDSYNGGLPSYIITNKNAVRKHIALPVSEGEKYIVDTSGLVNIAFAAENITEPTQYELLGAVDNRLYKIRNTQILEVPEGASYMIIGTSVTILGDMTVNLNSIKRYNGSHLLDLALTTTIDKDMVDNSMLKESLGIYSVTSVASKDFIKGYYNRSGTLVNNSSYNSDKISVEQGQVLFYRIRVGSGFDPYAYRLIAFDSNNTYIPLASITGDSQVSSEYVDGLYIVPEGVSYVCVCSVSMEDVYAKVCNVKLMDILKVHNIDNSTQKENLAFPSVANVLRNQFVNGYYNRAGSLVSNASYNSGKINVTQGQIVFYRIKVSAGFDPYAYRLIAFNGQNVYIPSKSVTGNAQSTMYISDVYVVPEGVSSICVSTMSRDEAYVKVCDSHLMETLKDSEKCYYVGAGHSYGSLIGLFESLKGDTSKKTIYIDAGTYDIFQDYLDNNITPPADGHTNTADYFDYNSFLPPNTKLVGLGKVILEMKPTKQQLLNYAQSLSDTTDVNARTLIISKIWSPLNISGACEIENITIETKNVRYCIHDDMHGADTDSVHIYHNVNCMTDIPEDIDGETLGFSITVGMGWASGSRHEYNDCVFENKNSKRSFYGHGTSNKGSTLTFNHCAFVGDSNHNDSVNFQTLNGDIYSKVLIAGCYIMGSIHLHLYRSATHNVFDLTLLNCNQIVGTNPKYVIDDNNNPYPIKEY